MKRFLAALVITLVLNQPVLAVEPPAGVVKFRKCLETLRNDIFKYDIRVNNVFFDEAWTQEDTKYLNSHTTDEDANNVGMGLGLLLGALENAIVKLGGNKNPNEQESIKILEEVSNESKQMRD